MSMFIDAKQDSLAGAKEYRKTRFTKVFSKDFRNDECPNSCVGGCVVYIFADMTNNCLNKASRTSRFIVHGRCIFYTISLV